MNEEYLTDLIVTELKVIATENDLEISNIDSDTILFGVNSVVDSLDLVSLIVKVEEHIFDKTEKEIQIIDEDSVISDGKTPFKNAITLANVIVNKLREKYLDYHNRENRIEQVDNLLKMIKKNN